MKVAIIGGGAAGLVAGIVAASGKNDVTIFEKNSKCGKKLLLTGNGKCNLAPLYLDLNKIHSESGRKDLFVREEERLKYIEFLEKLGLVMTTKKGGIYPFSEKSSSVLSVLLNAYLQNGGKLICDYGVSDLKVLDKGFLVNDKYFDKVIVTTGSRAYPKTGSTGGGYELLKRLGVQMTVLSESLVPVVTNSGLEKDWAGLRANVCIYLKENDAIVKKEEGEIQFTKYGLSGICVFNLSGDIKLGLMKGNKEAIVINFMSWLGSDAFEFLEKRNKDLPGRSISLLLDGFMDYKLSSVLLKALKISLEATWDDIGVQKQRKLATMLTEFQIDIENTLDFDSAQVCKGGVMLEEIDEENMQLKKYPGLYLAGEILDLDGDCGGYNLAIAFITGMKAGELK